jgi:hypothetical protein
MWDGEHSGRCFDMYAMILSHAITSIVMDLWMLAIPLSQMIHIQLSWSKKAGVILMFCLGTLWVRSYKLGSLILMTSQRHGRLHRPASLYHEAQSHNESHLGPV